MFNALVHDECSQLAEDRKSLACQPQSWRISAYLPLQKVLHTKTMHHVVGDKAWAIKRGNESLLGLSHEKPSSKMTETRTTFLSDVNE